MAFHIIGGKKGYSINAVGLSELISQISLLFIVHVTKGQIFKSTKCFDKSIRNIKYDHLKRKLIDV